MNLPVCWEVICSLLYGCELSRESHDESVYQRTLVALDVVCEEFLTFLEASVEDIPEGF